MPAKLHIGASIAGFGPVRRELQAGQNNRIACEIGAYSRQRKNYNPLDVVPLVKVIVTKLRLLPPSAIILSRGGMVSALHFLAFFPG